MRCRALLGTIAVGVLLAAAEPAGAAVVATLPAGDGFSSLAATSTGAVWATRTEPGGKVGIGQLTPSGFAWRSVRVAHTAPVEVAASEEKPSPAGSVATTAAPAGSAAASSTPTAIVPSSALHRIPGLHVRDGRNSSRHGDVQFFCVTG